MKIVHVMSYFQPKLGYQEYYLVKEQQRLGHRVCVITSDRYQFNKSFSRIFGDVLKNRWVGTGEFVEEGIKVIRLPCYFEFYDQIFLRHLFKTLSHFSPDVICVHDQISHAATTCLIYKTLFKLPIVMDVHADYGNMTSSTLRRLFFKVLSRNPVYRAIYKTADAIIAISNDSKTWVGNEMAVAKGVTIVPLAAEISQFYPDLAKRREIRKKLGVENSVLLIYAGRFIPEKEIELLIEAASYLFRKGLNIKVLIIGNGAEDYELKLHSIVEKLQLKRIVTFVPYVTKKELPGLYNAADIGVWPGGASITIIEAMATGLPVVIPVLRNTSHFFEYDIGFNFTKGNVVELERSLEKLILDKSMRHKKGKEALRMTLENLNWQSVNWKTVEIYKSVINKNLSKYKRAK